MSISLKNKTIAKTVANVFEGKPIVTKYWDNDHKNSIDILLCKDKLEEGINSYATIGLSDYSIGYTLDEYQLRVEIIGVTGTFFEEFPLILSSCAFNIINSKFSCHHGTVFPNIVNFYIPDSDMKHIYFTYPFLWDDKLKTIDFDNLKVLWLLVVPISEAELLYAEEKGTDALEDLFEEHQIDIFNLNRKSVL